MPFKARALARAKEQPLSKNLYVLGRFDNEGNFLGFVQNSNEANQVRGYIGNRAGKAGRNVYQRKYPNEIIEAMWVEKFRIARFYNKDGSKGTYNSNVK